MFRTSWPQWLLGKSRRARRGQAPRNGFRCHHLQIERLEDRTLLSTWTSQILNRGSGDRATFGQQSEAGHPSYEFGTHSHNTHNATTTITTTITVALLSTSTSTYDPAVGGPITSIDFGVDFKLLDGQSVLVGFLLRQNNIYYAGGVVASQSPSWQHLAGSLSAGDFTRVNGFDHPTFAANGGAMQFGVFTATTGAPWYHSRECIGWAQHYPYPCVQWQPAYWEPEVVSYGLDNFSVVDHPLAQPATHFLVVPSTLTPLAGAPFSVTVTALDANNNRDYSYHGTVRFSCTDTTATLPANQPFTTGPGADNGMHVFNGVILRKSRSWTITVTDTVTTANFGFSIVNVSPDVATTLELQVPSILVAGAGRGVTGTSPGRFGNQASGYRGTVPITTSDPSATRPPAHVFTAGDSGTYTWVNGLTLFTAGPQTVTVSDPGAPALPATTVTVSVIPGAPYRCLVLRVPATLTAGTVSDTTAVVEDRYDNTVTGYRGTAHWTSTDPQATLPPDYTYQDYDEGSHLFRNALVLRTAGSQTVTVTDTVDQNLTGSVTVTVLLAGASTLEVSCNPSSLTAGDSTTCTVTARDPFHNVAVGYRGIVRFTSSDGQATLPGIYPFTAGDNGVHTFRVTLRTAGRQTVTVTDIVATSLQGIGTITVAPAAATSLTLRGVPTTTTAGVEWMSTVAALDPFGNTNTNYAGTVHFSSSDPQAVLPGDHLFVASDNGVVTFQATLKTAGAQAITATDTVTATLLGSQTGIQVSAAAADHFQLDIVGVPMANVPFDLVVTARDMYGNIDPTYRGTVVFWTSDQDPGVVLPGSYTFTDGDSGTHTFGGGVTLVTLGE